MKKGKIAVSLLLAALLCLGMLGGAIADGYAYGGSYVVITHPNTVNVRAGGGTQYTVVGAAYPGCSYAYLGTTASGWYTIELDNGVTGCISPAMGYVTGSRGSTPSSGTYDGTCSYFIGNVRVNNPYGSYIDMYAQPNEAVGLLRHAYNGSYGCVGAIDGWYIIVCEGYMGYVHAYDVTYSHSPENTYTPSAIGIVWIQTENIVNVRAGANQYTEKLMGVCPGSSFLCTGIDRATGWYEVLLPGGSYGYISNKLGTFTDLGNG